MIIIVASVIGSSIALANANYAERSEVKAMVKIQKNLRKTTANIASRRCELELLKAESENRADAAAKRLLALKRQNEEGAHRERTDSYRVHTDASTHTNIAFACVCSGGLGHLQGDRSSAGRLGLGG